MRGLAGNDRLLGKPGDDGFVAMVPDDKVDHVYCSTEYDTVTVLDERVWTDVLVNCEDVIIEGAS